MTTIKEKKIEKAIQMLRKNLARRKKQQELLDKQKKSQKKG